MLRNKRSVFLISLIFLAAAAYGLYELMGSRSFQLFGGMVAKVETSEKAVALTLDDGPGVNTDEALRVLQEAGVKATFFLTGREIEENMAAAQKIVQAGHELGNHSYSHKRMVFKSSGFIRSEIERTDELIRQAGYKGEIHFRPPYGKRLLLLPYYLKQHNRKTIYMNLEPDSIAEIAGDERRMVEYASSRIEPGSIILMHVMYQSRRASLAAIKSMIAEIQGQGYRFVTVSELLQYESKR